MSRPASVTAAAVVAFIGCAVTLLMGVGMIVVTLTEGAPSPMPKQFGVGMGTMFAGLAALGVATGIGVLRLREWARIAMLIFAGAVTLFSGFGAAIVLAVPLPQDPSVGAGVARAVISAVYAVPLAVGVWWLVLFTRSSIVSAFAQPDATGMPTPSPRPLMVTIIGYWVIVGGAGSLLMSSMGMPAFVAGFVLQGLGGAVAYVALGALNLYAGWGLLKLREQARVLCIALFALTVVQSVAVAVSPDLRQAMLAAQQAMSPQTTEQPVAFDAAQLSSWFMALAAAIAAAGIWFLVRARPAFKTTLQQQQP